MVSLPSFMHPESMNIGKNRIPVIMAKCLIRFDIGCTIIVKSVFKDTKFFQFNIILLNFFNFLLISFCGHSYITPPMERGGMIN